MVIFMIYIAIYFINNACRKFILQYLGLRSYWVRYLFRVENKSRGHHKGNHLHMLVDCYNMPGISDPLTWI